MFFCCLEYLLFNFIFTYLKTKKYRYLIILWLFNQCKYTNSSLSQKTPNTTLSYSSIITTTLKQISKEEDAKLLAEHNKFALEKRKMAEDKNIKDKKPKVDSAAAPAKDANQKMRK